MIRANCRKPGGAAPIRLCSLVVAVLAGCGGPKLEYTEVTGKATLAGEPLVGAQVRFYPVGATNEQLPYSTGFTDRTGTYTLKAQTGETGALLGRHRVVVSWPSRDIREVAKLPAPPPEQMIPVHYTVASDSPLQFEVRPGKNVIDLPLEP